MHAIHAHWPKLCISPANAMSYCYNSYHRPTQTCPMPQATHSCHQHMLLQFVQLLHPAQTHTKSNSAWHCVPDTNHCYCRLVLQ
jgi:hypothetical protein